MKERKIHKAEMPSKSPKFGSLFSKHRWALCGVELSHITGPLARFTTVDDIARVTCKTCLRINAKTTNGA